MPQRIDYPHLPAPAGPYAHAVRHGASLYLSGLTAAGLEEEHADAAAQTRAVLRQIEDVLAHEDLGWEALVKVGVFVTDLADLAAVRAALDEAYGETPPAGSLVCVQALLAPSLKIEIEAVLALGLR
ncbi:RidA family protein [Lysobacter sp. 1R34A]|uniref:RidA family protein n=1 Tax=Lysobacter sp. 1R34A TaxID=3445786 RepID=UPI003EEC12C2